MKKLILLSGLPGSGKSFYISAHLEGAEIISSDEIRIKITGTYKKMAPDMSVVYNKMIEEANNLFATRDDVTVALDSTFLDDARRNYFLDRISGQDETHLIMLRAHDLTTVLQRNKMRKADKHVPEEVIFEMAKRYCEPSEEYKNRYTSIKVRWID